MADGTDDDKAPGAGKGDPDFKDISVDAPRLTPQGRTDPMGTGAKAGQSDKAEG